MDKTNLILDLVKEGKITNEQAKVLLETEKEYVYYPTYPRTYYPYPSWPYNPITFCGTSGNAVNTLTVNSSN